MWNYHRCFARLCEFLQGVEILGNKHHVNHFLGLQSTRLLHIIDALLESFRDFLTHFCNTFTSELGRLRICLSSLDLQNLVCLCSLLHCTALSLLGVDIIHRTQHLGIRLEVGNENFGNSVAELSHRLGQSFLDVICHLCLLLESLVQVQIG